MIKTTETYPLFSDYAKEIYEKTKDKRLENDGGYLVPEKITIPINKWQSFKQRFFPYWIQRIFPVKMKEVNFRKLLLGRLKEKEILE